MYTPLFSTVVLCHLRMHTPCLPSGHVTHLSSYMLSALLVTPTAPPLHAYCVHPCFHLYLPCAHTCGCMHLPVMSTGCALPSSSKVVHTNTMILDVVSLLSNMVLANGSRTWYMVGAHPRIHTYPSGWYSVIPQVGPSGWSAAIVARVVYGVNLGYPEYPPISGGQPGRCPPPYVRTTRFSPDLAYGRGQMGVSQ